MKATCPKCGRVLRAWEWRQNCPQCGVNLIGYDLQARLQRDADQAETEFAMVQPYIDRAKASYVGSKAAIVRMVCHLLPFGMLFLPLCRSNGEWMQIVNIVQSVIYIVQHGMLQQVLHMPTGELVPLIGALAGTVLCILSVIVHLGFLAGSCSQKGRRRLFRFDAVMILIAGASVACLCALSAAQGAEMLAPGVGAFAYLASFIALTVYDIVLARTGIPVQYTQCYIAGIPAEEFLQQQEATAHS